MSEKVLVALRDAAKKAGITPAQAKYWVKLLGVALVMKGRVGFLEMETADDLAKMASRVNEGASPKNAAFEISGVVPGKDVVPIELAESGGLEELKEKLEKLEAKNGFIEKALLMLAEESRATRQEMARLTEANQALRMRLEPPLMSAVFQAPAQPVKAWTPTRKPDPLEGAGIIKRVWTILVHPEQMRRNPT